MGSLAAEECECGRGQRKFIAFLSYFGRLKFLLIVQLLILQLLHFVLENPQLSKQALKQNAFKV